MSFHMTTRVPVDDKYATLVGKAVYVFAYYEWTLIWIIEKLDAGFVGSYCRDKQLTSGGVLKHLEKVLKCSKTDFSKISKVQLQGCYDTFEKMIVKRNALIHAHPVIDQDGSQILNYQTMLSKPLPDMKWPKIEIEKIVFEFDAAAIVASELFEILR